MALKWYEYLEDQIDPDEWPEGFSLLLERKCPEEAKGRRVVVYLENGHLGTWYDEPMISPGWAADGPKGCNWRKDDIDGGWNIKYYRVI